MRSGGGCRSVHLPGPAQVRRLRAAGVFPGASGRIQALETPGLCIGVGGGGGKGERWPEIRAVMASGQEPPWAQARAPRKGSGLVQHQKAAAVQPHPESSSPRKAPTPKLIFLVFMTSWWLKGWAVPEVLALP